jgi:hypothetical protein
MSLPCIAATLDGSGPFYAAWSTTQTLPDEQLVAWMPHPVFPAGAEHLFRWATEADGIETPHVTLNVIAYATLLFLAGLDPLADDDLDDVTALAAIDATLTEAGCDLLRCAWRANVRLDEHPEDCPRWHRCEIRAARMLKVEA